MLLQKRIVLVLVGSVSQSVCKILRMIQNSFSVEQTMYNEITRCVVIHTVLERLLGLNSALVSIILSDVRRVMPRIN
jgi:hypothetical protein